MARRENHSIKIENNEKKNQILVSLSIVALLGGCSEEQVQRDVYQSLDDCLADWKKIELCEADKNTESTQKTETTPQQGLGLNIRDNGNAESAVKIQLKIMRKLIKARTMLNQRQKLKVPILL